MRKKFSLGVYSLVVLWLLLAILFIHVPPSSFWPAAFIALSIPGPLVLNILFLVVWLLRKSWKVFLPLALIFFSWNYYERAFALNLTSQETVIFNPDEKTLQVLSYNVRIFNTYAHLQDKNLTSSKKMIAWVATHPADIFCLQEFYNDKKSPVYNTISKISKKHNRHHFLSTTLENSIGAQFGLAIFSKYPIINKGTIQFGKLTQNHAMFADIKLKADTVRIYNFHLQSMSIEEQDILDTYNDQNNWKTQGRNVLRRFKKGFVKRADQVNMLLTHVESSPHPVILCGDLNDLPYSYTYQRLNENHANAFTEAGQGIGATYNGKLPFVRIDNQFSSLHFEVQQFTLHDSITYSDHFPLSAVYKLNR